MMENRIHHIHISKSKSESVGCLLSRKKVKPRFWILSMVLLVIVFAVFYFNQSRLMARNDSTIAQLTAQRDELTSANAQLTRKIDFAKTDAYVERVAHDELGLAMPGEIRFVSGGQPIGGATATAAPGAQISNGQ